MIDELWGRTRQGDEPIEAGMGEQFKTMRPLFEIRRIEALVADEALGIAASKGHSIAPFIALA